MSDNPTLTDCPAPASLWIVLVDYKGWHDTRRCLQSLDCMKHQTSVVVVNNDGANEDEALALKLDYPWISFLSSKHNGGWAGGNNQGIRYAMERGADLIVLLNNDTLVVPQFVERLQSAAAAYPLHGIIGPVIRHLDPPQNIQTEGTYFNRIGGNGFFQRQAVPLSTATGTKVVDTDIVNGCCLMLRSEVVERIGLIDEAYYLIHEESDFCLRAQQAGFRNGILAEDLVWHKGSSTFRREGNCYQRYYDARNLVRLIKRHSGPPERKGKNSSLLGHMRYAYHRYSQEVEANSPIAADAVLHGLWDGYCGKYGPCATRFRPGLRLIRWLFQATYALRRLQKYCGTASPGETKP